MADAASTMTCRTPVSGYHRAGVSTTRPRTCATRSILSRIFWASASSFDKSTPARFMSRTSSRHLELILAHRFRSSPAARWGNKGATASHFTRPAEAS